MGAGTGIPALNLLAEIGIKYEKITFRRPWGILSGKPPMHNIPIPISRTTLSMPCKASPAGEIEWNIRQTGLRINLPVNIPVLDAINEYAKDTLTKQWRESVLEYFDIPERLLQDFFNHQCIVIKGFQ